MLKLIIVYAIIFFIIYTLQKFIKNIIFNKSTKNDLNSNTSSFIDVDFEEVDDVTDNEKK
tara:strand:+ start:349 stop:528 length:180 start_codon:yes stop_codon:yes gene_type:complete